MHASGQMLSCSMSEACIRPLARTMQPQLTLRRSATHALWTWEVAPRRGRCCSPFVCSLVTALVMLRQGFGGC